MKRAAASILFFLPLAAPPAARAACPDAYSAIIAEISRVHGESLTCDDMRHAVRQLPIRAESQTHADFGFAGELDLRADLRERLDVSIPADILVLGSIERKAPAGIKQLILFGQHAPGRLEAVIRLARREEPVPRANAAEAVGNGAWFNRIGLYVEAPDGGTNHEGTWRSMGRGGLWSVHQAPPEGVRACLPCEGWLCPKDPIACFSDFNDNGLEEVHFTNICPGGSCGLAVLEPMKDGKVVMILNQNITGARWLKSPKGWALLRKPYCKQGTFCGAGERSLGNPSCERPPVYLVRPGDAQPAKTSAAEKDRFFPITHKRWPLDCEIEKGPVELVYSPEGGFVMYEK